MAEATQLVQIRLPAAMHQALRDEAKRQERSMTWLVTKIIAAAVASPKQGAAQ